MKLADSTDRFIQERRILNNVSPATIQWYRYSLRAFQPVLEAGFESIGLFKGYIIEGIYSDQKEADDDHNHNPDAIAGSLKVRDVNEDGGGA